MMKLCIRYFVTLFMSVGFAGVAFAQSPLVQQYLGKKYSGVWPAEEGIILVSKGGYRVTNPLVSTNGKYGYVDLSGEQVVAPKYDFASSFHNGFAVVGMIGASGNQRKLGLIDRSGREIIACVWDNLTGVSDGIAVARSGMGDDSKFSLIDTLGNAREIKYNFCRGFEKGYAVVGQGTYRLEERTHIPGTKQEPFLPPNYVFAGKYGYMTPDGKLAIPMEFDDARNFDDTGMAAAGMQGKYYMKWGFIDRTGKWIVPANYFSVSGFRRELAVVSKIIAGGKQAFGYIDRAGREVIACQYDEAAAFTHTNTWVGMLQADGSSVYMLIDTKGESQLLYTIVDLQDGGKYGQAAAAIRNENGELRYGIVGNAGNLLLPFEYDEITIFSEWDAANNRWQEGAMATKDGNQYSFDITKN